MSIMVLPAVTLSRVANKGRKWVFTENLKLVLLQFTVNKIGLSRFTKNKTFLTRIYDFTVAFVVSSLENPQGPQGSSSNEKLRKLLTKVRQCFKRKSEAQQTSSLVEVGSSANFLLGARSRFGWVIRFNNRLLY